MIDFYTCYDLDRKQNLPFVDELGYKFSYEDSAATIYNFYSRKQEELAQRQHSINNQNSLDHIKAQEMIDFIEKAKTFFINDETKMQYDQAIKEAYLSSVSQNSSLTPTKAPQTSYLIKNILISMTGLLVLLVGLLYLGLSPSLIVILALVFFLLFVLI